MTNVGFATLDVVPDLAGFSKKLSRGVKGALGVGGLGAAFGVASFIKDSVQLEAKFSRTMSQMRVTTQSSGKEMQKLDDLAIKLGRETVFSANEASSAMLELAKNGIKPAVIEAGALQSALTLAAAGGTDLTFAAQTMGNAINAFGLKGKDAASVAASLAGAANASSASVESLAQGLQQASASAADSGFNIQETTAALAAFANAGISGSDAGTSLKTMLARLVPTTKKAKDAMKDYGLLTFDASKAQEALATVGLKATSNEYADVSKAVGKYLIKQGVATAGTAKLADATEAFLMETGALRNDFLKSNGDFKNLADISGVLNEAFSDLSDSERSLALNTLFGSDARRAATVLTNEGEKGLRKYIKATSDQQAAERLAKANMEGTAGAMERLSGAWETTRLEFGKAIAPTVEKFLNFMSSKMDELSPKLTDFGEWLDKDGAPALEHFAKELKNVVQAFNDMPDWARKAILGGTVVGLGAKKLGVLSVAKSAAGGLLARGSSPANPLFVSDIGKGLGGGGVGGATALSKLGRAGQVGLVAAAAVEVIAGTRQWNKDFKTSVIGSQGGHGSPFGGPQSDVVTKSWTEQYANLNEEVKRNNRLFVVGKQDVEEFGGAIRERIPRTIHTTVTGWDVAQQDVRDYIALLLQARATHIDARIDAAGGTGPTQPPNHTPPPSRGGNGGITIINEKVVAQDVNAFLADMHNRAHRASSDGVRR